MAHTLNILSWNFEHLRISKIEKNLKAVQQLLLPYDVVFLYEHKRSNKNPGPMLAELLTQYGEEAMMHAFLDDLGGFSRVRGAKWAHLNIDVGTNEDVIVLWRTTFSPPGVDMDSPPALDVSVNTHVLDMMQRLFMQLGMDDATETGEDKLGLMDEKGELTIRYPAPVRISINGHKVLDVLAWHAPRPNRLLTMMLHGQITQRLDEAGCVVDVILGDMNVEPEYGHPLIVSGSEEKEDPFSMSEKPKIERSTRSTSKKMKLDTSDSKPRGTSWKLADMYLPRKTKTSTLSGSFDSSRLCPIDFAWVRGDLREHFSGALASHVSARMTFQASDHKPVRFVFTLDDKVLLYKDSSEEKPSTSRVLKKATKKKPLKKPGMDLEEPIDKDDTWARFVATLEKKKW
jgi:endonuclease/exonuclease/phosphatase family metal-dependent hydrolase